MESTLFGIRFIFNLFLHFLLINIPFTTSSLNTVLTTRGPVRGTIQNGGPGLSFTSFHGIPYAKPAIGHRRFQNPELPDEWSYILWATHPRSPCIARDFDTGVIDGEEDCLYLDVFTGRSSIERTLQEKHWPVLVVLAGVPRVNVQPLIWVSRQVVLVVVHHRLQLLGLLSDNDHSPAFMDQLTALQWVHENIIAFGGDPDNVTIVGEGESALHVASLLWFPSARGLFTRVGIFSAPLGIISKDATRAFASRVGCPLGSLRDIVSCFSHMDVRGLMERQTAYQLVPLVKLSGTPSSHVPCVIGTMSRDGAGFLRRIAKEDVGVYLSRVVEKVDLLKDAVKVFYGSHSVTSEIILDSIFYSPALRLAKEYSQYSSTFLFEVTFPASSITQLLFGDLPSGGDIDERIVMDTMSTLFTNFVTKSNPSSFDLPPWNRVTIDPKCYEINIESKMSLTCQRHSQSSFWDAIKTIDNQLNTTLPTTPPSCIKPNSSYSCLGVTLTLILFIFWCTSLTIAFFYLLLQLYSPNWKSSLISRFPHLQRWLPTKI